METKEIVITPPEGFEIDEEKSTFKKYYLRKKKQDFLKIGKSFMKPIKKQGWINIYRDSKTNQITSGLNIYETKELAIIGAKGRDYSNTIQIEWEEEQ